MMIPEMNKILLTNAISANASEVNIIDFAKLMSSLNRKHIPSVDRAGNAQMFLIKVSPLSGVNVLTSVETAPNLYLTKDAVKEWHDARVKMITRTGAKMDDLGPYARHLRPFLNVDHENGTVAELDTETAPNGFALNTHFQGDEYTRSRLAVTTPAENTDVSNNRIMGDDVDTYSLTLCGSSVLESTTPDDPDESTGGSDQDSFVSVGMIEDYLKSIKKRPVGTSDAERIQSDCALLQINADSSSSEEVLEIVEDSAEEGRPWDLDGSAYTAITFGGYSRTNSNNAQSFVVEVPCGLMKFSQANGDGSQDTISTQFEIMGIYDME